MRMVAIQTAKQANTTAMVAEVAVHLSPPRYLEEGRALMQTVLQHELQAPRLFIVEIPGTVPILIGTMTVSGVNNESDNEHN